MSIKRKLVSRKQRVELPTARKQIAAFLTSEPETLVNPQGVLKASERKLRLELAEKYVNDPVIDWLAESGGNLSLFVDSHADISRLEFCQLLIGDWVPEKN